MEQIAVVTGAARGIGREVSRQLADRGMTVVLTARDLAAAVDAAREMPGDVRPLPLDVADEASVVALADVLQREYGRLNVLVNNAAAAADWAEKSSTADLAEVAAAFHTNVIGPWRLIQTLLPLLRATPGARVVNVSSGAGSHGDDQFGLVARQGTAAGYGVSKAALNALTAAVAAELAGSGVLINAVCPGLTATAPGMESMGARPVSEGAASVVWAATLPPDGPTGGFFRDGRPLPW